VGDHDRVRRSYDAVATEYLSHFHDELAGKPLDRALLSALVEESRPGGSIADIGCGPGHVTGWLADQGAHAVGIDLSPQMVATARQARPALDFRVGDLLDLPASNGEFTAVAALYSIIHLAPGDLPDALAEIGRVLVPAGRLLVAFHVGTEVRHRDEWWGQGIDLDFRFYPTETVTDALEAAGFTVEARLERVHYPDEVDTRRCYLWARRRPAP
jgi:SAM-dependent methyltransferase